jgi:hypothetical protein
VIGDHVERDALDRQPIDKMAIGRKMPQSRAAIVEIRPSSSYVCPVRAVAVSGNSDMAPDATHRS